MADVAPTAAPAVAYIWDDVGPEQGQVRSNQMTDDANPTVVVQLPAATATTDAPQAGDTLAILENGATIGRHVLTAGDLAQGYVDVFAASGLSRSGTQTLQAQITDGSGNASDPSPAFTLDLAPASGVTRTNLTDGGYVLSYSAASAPAESHVQRYDAAGEPQGQEIDYAGFGFYSGQYSVTPLIGGHFLALFFSGPQSGSMAGDVVDGSGRILAQPNMTGQAQAVAGAQGGFVLYSIYPFSGHGVYALYNNDGVAESGTVELGGPITAVTPEPNGTIDIAWTYGPTTNTTNVDPRVPAGAILQGQAGGSNLTGGGGADTLVGGSGPDTMTGATGADHFVFNSVPWSPGHITDFTEGTDKLDLSALLSAAHYTGSDPVADGYVKVLDDGHGDSWLYFDRDGRGAADPWGSFIATLDHVAPASITGADLVGGASASPPPPSPPPPSANATLSISGAQNHFEGAAGADTPFTFTVTRTGDTSGQATVNWAVQSAAAHAPAGQPASGPQYDGTDNADFTGALSGMLTFAPGETTQTITVHVHGDDTPENDEQFAVVLSNAAGAALGDIASVPAQILNDDGPLSPPPPASGGQKLQGQAGGSHLTGGAGDDTLTGGSGPDVMTGSGGADHFAFNNLPWSAAEIIDFTHATDKLDLSGLLSAAHYSSADPIGDGYVKFIDNGQGGAWLYFDSDGHGTGDPWGTFVATLDHVTAASFSAADLVGGIQPPPVPSPPPPASGGQTLQGQAGGSNLQGGAGDDTLIGGSGPDTMTGAGGADHFVYHSRPWSAGQITDFAHGADKLDLSGLLAGARYAGSDPIADGYVRLLADGHGDTWVYFDSDGHGGADPWGTFVTTVNGVPPGSLTAVDFIF